MLMLNSLCLQGYGYLEEVTIKKNQTIARICCVCTGSQNREEIWLDCKLNAVLEKELMVFQSTWGTEHTILLHFSASYEEFSACHTGQTVNDPQQVLMFQCKLTAIHDVFVDGKRNFMFATDLNELNQATYQPMLRLNS